MSEINMQQFGLVNKAKNKNIERERKYEKKNVRIIDVCCNNKEFCLLFTLKSSGSKLTNISRKYTNSILR